MVLTSLFNFVGMREKFTPSFALCSTIIIVNLLITVHKACSYVVYTVYEYIFVATDSSLERHSRCVMLW